MSLQINGVLYTWNMNILLHLDNKNMTYILHKMYIYRNWCSVSHWFIINRSSNDTIFPYKGKKQWSCECINIPKHGLRLTTLALSYSVAPNATQPYWCNVWLVAYPTNPASGPSDCLHSDQLTVPSGSSQVPGPCRVYTSSVSQTVDIKCTSVEGPHLIKSDFNKGSISRSMG
jgi:hypothetical protein